MNSMSRVSPNAKNTHDKCDLSTFHDQAEQVEERTTPRDKKAATQDQEEVDCEHEGVPPNVAKDPGQPSKGEVEGHRAACHVLYRAWCAMCVRGRGRDRMHKSCSEKDPEEVKVPKIAIDYCFIADRGGAAQLVEGKEIQDHERTDEKKSQTVLVMKDYVHQSVWAYPVGKKGDQDEAWVARQLTEDLKTLGLHEFNIIMKSDGEASIKDVKNAVSGRRAHDFHGRIAMEESPVGDSNANGKIERAIQELTGVVRTMKIALEENIRESIPIDHPAVPWMIRHASEAITRYQIRDTGKTSFRMARGFNSFIPVAEFGEHVLFKAPKTPKNTGSYVDRFIEGVYLGSDMRTGHSIVGTSEGVYRGGVVRRRQPDERWSKKSLDELATMEDTMKQGHDGQIPTYTRAVKSEPAIPVIFTPSEEQATARQFKIYKNDIHEHGPTEGCKGCKAIARGGRDGHSEGCRKRFKEIIEKHEEGQDRIARTEDRMVRAIARESDRLMNDKQALDPCQPVAQDKQALDPCQPLDRTNIKFENVQEARMEEVVLTEGEISQRGRKRASETQLEDPGERPELVMHAPSLPSEGQPSLVMHAPPLPSTPARGTKRRSEDEPDDPGVEKAQDNKADATEDALMTPVIKSNKMASPMVYSPESPADESSAIGSISKNHPGPRVRPEAVRHEEMQWKYMGSGIMARTFLNAKRLITTTKKGPAESEVKRRVIRNLATGKVIDQCEPEHTPDRVLNRELPEPTHIRVELELKEAE